MYELISESEKLVFYLLFWCFRYCVLLLLSQNKIMFYQRIYYKRHNNKKKYKIISDYCHLKRNKSIKFIFNLIIFHIFIIYFMNIM